MPLFFNETEENYAYVDKIVPRYTEEDFRGMFRMIPGTFHILLDISYVLDYIKYFHEILPSGHGRGDPTSTEK